MISILDYDAGNIKSVEKAVQYLGEDAVITRDRDVIMASDKVILPGVGSFGDAMNKTSRFLGYVLDFSFCSRPVRNHRRPQDLESWTVRYFVYRMHRDSRFRR